MLAVLNRSRKPKQRAESSYKLQKDPEWGVNPQLDQQQSVHIHFNECQRVHLSYLRRCHSPGSNETVLSVNRRLPWPTWPQSATSDFAQPIQSPLIVFSWLENDQKQQLKG